MAPDFRKLFESFPGIYLALSPELKILAVSDLYLAVTGESRNKIVGRNVAEVLPPAAAQTNHSNIITSLQNVIANRKTYTTPVEQYRIDSAVNDITDIRYWLQTSTPVMADDGESVEYIIHHIQDVTDFTHERTNNTKKQNTGANANISDSSLQQIIEHLLRVNQELKETEQIKSDFFTSVSHELRTPLSLILAPVESVISGKYGILSDEQLHALKTVQNNSIRLLQIVNGLLDFSKFEAGKMTIERESTDLNYMTQAILKDFESLFRTKKIELTYETNLARRYALIDRYLFERILFNLLSNAVKFTPEYGKVHVTISAEEDNIKLTVTDTGKGITESEMQSLFTKFRQAESSSSRRFEGSGLGLAMVKEFAELLDGGVQVSSKPGEGSIFTVILRAPATDLVPAETEFRLKRPVLLPQQHHFAGQYESRFVKSDVQLKMLVCEDNEELQSYIVSLVNELCQVRTAKDGEEAARIIKSWKPDLVLSDIMMPKKDGIELCKEIKRNPETSHIAVILLTALTHREALLKGWEARADEYLFKPFHPEELITRVKSMLLSIKDRYEATGKIEEKNRELQVINSEMENFTYSVSHDLRAPLRAIDGYARIIEEDYTSVLDTEGRRLLNEVRRNAQKMGGLIDNLLTLSRVGRKEINRTVLDMNEMVQQVIVEVERTTHHKAKITLANLYPVAADRNLIIQMLQNLVSNAIKYTSKVAQPVIEITSTKEKNQIIYKISDNGAGFDMKYINKLFGVFQRLHTTEDFEGTGVGLAIVQRIIHKHGGRVWAEGEVGNGACFYFSLPALPEGMPKEAIIENDPKN